MLISYMSYLSPLTRENLEASAEERDVIMQYSFTVSLNALKIYSANINLLVPLIQKVCYITDCKYFIKPQVLVDNFCTELECSSWMG